jgi:hypothetical protein
MFEREYFWLEKKGWGCPLLCTFCNEPIQIDNEVITFGGQGMGKHHINISKKIFHSSCYDKFLEAEKAKKPITREKHSNSEWLVDPIT